MSGTEQVEQLTKADLRHMTPEQIVAARKAGRLADVLRPTADAPVDDGQLSRADLRRMAPEEVTAARKAGLLAHLHVSRHGGDAA